MLTAGSPKSALLFVALGSACLGAGALAAVVAVAGRAGLSPGRRALLHWAPIAAAVVVARSMGWSDIAIGIIFGTSVAVLSTVVGSLCTIAPVGPAPPRWKRLWPFTLAAALIVFVSGFNGLLTWKHGLALALEGLVVLSLWRDPTSDHDWGSTIALGDPRMLLSPAAEWVTGVASLLLAGGGAWLATTGTVGLGQLSVHVSHGAVAASLLSLVLATPMVQSGRQLALAGASWIPMTAHIGVVLLNLCLLLPIIALAPYGMALYRTMRFQGRLSIDFSTFSPHLTVFPLAAWRIDTVVLVLLSVLFLPVASGKWNLGREEGFILIVGYCVYLLAVTVVGM